MTRNFSFSYLDDDTPDGTVQLHITEYQWWWDVPVRVADALCVLSRHRLCNSLVRWAYELSERHITKSLEIPVDRASWLKWAEMTGVEDPSWWWEER